MAQTWMTERLQLEKDVIAGIADRNHDEATNHVSKLLAEGRINASHWVATVVNKVIRQDGSLVASNWATTSQDWPLKGSARNELAERNAQTNPKSAAEWFENLLPKNMRHAQSPRSVENGPSVIL